MSSTAKPEWVLASHNQGKLREFRELLSEVPVLLRSSAELLLPEPDENASTFIENALLKARSACSLSGLPALADDSGLVVSALAGAPGLHSARYAGIPQSATRNVEKLLAAMSDVPEDARDAQFVCVIVALRHASDPCPLIAQGTWTGSILCEPRGALGFGYDPIFLDPGSGRSAAELPSEQKHAVSHRGKAMRRLLSQLKMHWLGDAISAVRE